MPLMLCLQKYLILLAIVTGMGIIWEASNSANYLSVPEYRVLFGTYMVSCTRLKPSFFKR